MPFARFVARDRSLGRNSTGTRNSLLMSSRFLLPPFPQGAPFPNFLLPRNIFRSWHGLQLAQACNHLAELPCVNKPELGKLRAFHFTHDYLDRVAACVHVCFHAFMGWVGSCAIYGPSKDGLCSSSVFSLFSLLFLSFLFSFIIIEESTEKLCSKNVGFVKGYSVCR